MNKRFTTLMTTLILSVFFSISASANVEVDGIYYYYDNVHNTASVTFVEKNIFGNVIIPNSITINGKECQVDGIMENAFKDCSGLTSVTIPNSATFIGPRAFQNCSGLTSVIIPNSVTIIGDQAFQGCSSLTSINIPNSVKKISWCCFESSGLTSVTIPNSVVTIEDYAFQLCRNLESVCIPNSVTRIGEAAFKWCNSLTSVDIPNSVTFIGKESFYDCNRLTTLSIPNSVTMIQVAAFYSCDNLTKLYTDCTIIPYLDPQVLEELYIGDNLKIISGFGNMPLRKVVLGKSVSKINDKAFFSSKIEEFTITGDEPLNCNENIFGMQDLSNAILYVPENKLEYYLTTEPWSTFGKVLAICEDEPTKPKQCTTPKISYIDGELIFDCETDGVEYYSSITSDDINNFKTNKITLTACYNISVTATKPGYVNSDIATAKLYWLPSSGTLEGDNINNVAMRGIAIQSASGFINISGLDNNEKVDFYGVDGKTLGSAKSIDGSVSFSAKQGTVVVAKIGKESLKIAVE